MLQNVLATLAHRRGSAHYGRISTTGAITTIVAPASNVNGILVLYAFVQYNPDTGAREQELVYATSAPTGPRQGFPVVYTAVSSLAQGAQQLQTPALIPPGFGLYDVPESNTSRSVCRVDYIIL